jgi:hypothetical protein
MTLWFDFGVIPKSCTHVFIITFSFDLDLRNPLYSFHPQLMWHHAIPIVYR